MAEPSLTRSKTDDWADLRLLRCAKRANPPGLFANIGSEP